METPAKIERGDLTSYLISLVLFISSIAFMVFIFNSFEPLLSEVRIDRSRWYMSASQTPAGQIWRCLDRCTSHPQSLWLPLLWMFSIYLIQSGLKKDHAKTLNGLNTKLAIVLALLVLWSPFYFLLPPITTKL